MIGKKFALLNRALASLLCLAVILNSQQGYAFNFYQFDDSQNRQEGKRSVDQIDSQESQHAGQSLGQDRSSDHFTPSYNTTALISEASKEFLSPNVAQGINSGNERAVPNQSDDQQRSDNPSESKLSLNKWNNDGSRSGTWERSFSDLNTDTKKEVMKKLDVQSKSSDVRIAAPAQAALNTIKSGHEDKVNVGVSFKYDEKKSDGQKVEMTGVGKVTVADHKTNEATASVGIDPKNESLKKQDMTSGPKMGETGEQEIKNPSNQTNPIAKQVESQNIGTRGTAKIESQNQPKEGNNELGPLLSLGSELKQSIKGTVTNLVASIFPGSKETQSPQETKQRTEPISKNPGTDTPVNNVSAVNPAAPANDSTSKPQGKTEQNSAVMLAGLSIPRIGSLGSHSNTNNIPMQALSPNDQNTKIIQPIKIDEKSNPTTPGIRNELNLGNNYSQSNVNNAASVFLFQAKGTQPPATQERTFTDTKTGSEMKLIKESDGNTTRSTTYRKDGQDWTPVRQTEKVTEGNTTRTTASLREGDTWVPVKQSVTTTENGQRKSFEETNYFPDRVTHETTKFGTQGLIFKDARYASEKVTLFSSGQAEKVTTLMNGNVFITKGTLTPVQAENIVALKNANNIRIDTKTITWENKSKDVSFNPDVQVKFGLSDHLSFAIPGWTIKESELNSFMGKSVLVGAVAAVLFLPSVTVGAAGLAFAGGKLLVDGLFMSKGDSSVGVGTLAFDVVSFGLPFKFLGSYNAYPVIWNVVSLVGGKSLEDYLHKKQ